MARSCGLRIGPRRFELVVLDGNAKKHKITAHTEGELPRDADDAMTEAIAVLKEAIKKHGVPKDNVGLAIDTGVAAFRTIKVPFADRNKIEQVLKFEVEGQLPQWNIDEVVVDFHILDSTGEASTLLITAVPKSEIKKVVTLCEKAGCEPQEVELETSAMVNAALAANICTPDTAQVLVHVGDLSTCVVVVDGGRVREMRAIHIGALTHESLAPTDIEPEAEEAPREGLAVLEPADPAELQRRLEQAIRRIRRELGRTVSAARCEHPIETIHVCGFDLPGLIGSKILDIPVVVLEAFEEDSGRPAEGFGPLVVAYGVALRQLGGGTLRPMLRREELRYTGAFERIELPLAIACLLLLTLLGVWNIFLFKEKTFVDNWVGTWRDQTAEALLGAPKRGKQGTLAYPSEVVARYAGNLSADTERNKFEQLEQLQRLLAADVKKLEKDLGQDAEVNQPQSALEAMTLVLDVLDGLGTDKAHPSIRKVASTYQLGRSGKPDSVRVTFDITFFAQNSVAATEFYESFSNTLKAQPWYVNFESRSTEPLDNGQGIYVAGMAVIVDVSKAPKATKVAQAEPK